MNPPDWPAGEYVPEPNPSDDRKRELIATVEAMPAKLTNLVIGQTPTELDRKYKNWTIRQIVHHLADSHINMFCRYRLALTEDNPEIRPYDETKWSELIDNRTMEIGPSLAILSAVHARWVMLLKAMTPEQFRRTYVHPEYKKVFTLDEALGMYAHHGRHHTAQIEWVITNRV